MDVSSAGSQTTRRSLLTAAAWSIPAIATTAAVPVTSSSSGPGPGPTLPPGVTVTSGNSPWTDAARYRGYIAEGILITLANDQGEPLPIGTAVTLRIEQVDRRWKYNNFYFVQDPTLSAEASRPRELHLQELTLILETPGQLSLYPTPTTGYLRKGSNGERYGVYLQVTTTGTDQYTGSAFLVNSSAAGGRNPGIRPQA